ncbi:energy-coupling factor transport system ATP-binding protein [Mycoplasmoides fastidiosum]|uniref:Energy-coupling factor transport system ATP-binding protein n=1 Tax=Mycoplasmoides fastidiosum TaxID=92758 RepID=A0ABU0M051_9BACT|nr:ATP-binding cassette domain-containing protein [Mycoplasmoides fastidiosum]MDQ0514322.1 energy-coupling factor transport system ATP-binding protein [Mycoplasmoides fastidiosum]UUD38075.1 ATP-binding cassette domain-containing protein [Mycoplasmoides fastidiosum]
MEQITSDNSAENDDVAVQLSDINFGYIENKPTVKAINFTITKGKYVCLIGHNGSGKSTLSKILMGLLKPWTGTVKISNQILSVATLKEILNYMGLIFQNPDNQFIGLSAEDDIAFGLENRKVPRDVIVEIIRLISEFMNIEDLLHKNATELSGGQKQKVAIASILAINPDIVIFDEATSMLDTFSKEEIKLLMATLSREYKKTVISITHDMEEVINCDEAIVLKNGELIAIMPPEQLFKNPEFLLSANLDLPFTIGLNHELAKQGVKTAYTTDLTELIASMKRA